ncbi:Yip1 family protein [Actibacterium sp. XHP0104]|uniref:Yip1 family protein n=1 Tax=Actibacterium sp. XHP0104 TaxID=2984335 RepID=UPI0021E97C34|nr:Yip1 family protein [Actibacterium sp. XHP0104]MCV2881219.1 YIP1 family protein [Actibacterium sp. XHP0104]
MSGASFWKDLLIDTLRTPRQAAARVLAIDVPMSALWQIMAVEVIASLVLTHLADALTPGAGPSMMPMDMRNPFVTVLFVAAMTVILVLLVDRVGGLFGGKGDFTGAFKLVLWQQAVILVFQVAQLLSMVVLPPFAPLIGIASYILTLWLLTNFVAELHGFRSRPLVFVGVLLTGILFGFVLIFVLQMLGLAPPPMEMT